MASSVPFSTTEYPLVSDPIFTSLYCAVSCSCIETGACALAKDKGKLVTARSASPGIRPCNFVDIVTPSDLALPKALHICGRHDRQPHSQESSRTFIGEGSVVIRRPL